MKRWISLPRQNLAALLVILSSWSILSSAVAVLKLYWEYISDPAWREWGFSFMEWMAGDWILIITRATLVGIGIGIVHYFLARALCRKKKHPIRIGETIKVVATAIILCTYPAFYLRKELKSIQIENECRQNELYGEIELLVKSGDVRNAVRRMEEACQMYQRAIHLAGPDENRYQILTRPPNGAGSFYGTLCNAWYSIALNLPSSLHSYMDSQLSNHNWAPLGHPYEDKQRKPLGIAMTESATPIIRVLGYWLLGERNRFAEEVYVQYDSGDKSFRTLMDLASFEVDPDPQRALRRIRRFKPVTAGDLPDFEEYEHFYSNAFFYYEEECAEAAYKRAIEVLKLGQTLEDPDHVRPKIEAYINLINSKPEYYSVDKSDLHKQLLNKLGIPDHL